MCVSSNRRNICMHNLHNTEGLDRCMYTLVYWIVETTVVWADEQSPGISRGILLMKKLWCMAHKNTIRMNYFITNIAKRFPDIDSEQLAD